MTVIFPFGPPGDGRREHDRDHDLAHEPGHAEEIQGEME